MALQNKHEEMFVQTTSEEVSRQLLSIGLKEVQNINGLHTFLNGGVLVFAGAGIDMSKCRFTDYFAEQVAV